MVRIEKAYTGYCIHQEEASQTMQELEKNEAVKLWLEVFLTVTKLKPGMQKTESGPHKGLGYPFASHKARAAGAKISATA